MSLATLSEIHDAVRVRLVEHDVRYTAGRRDVVATLRDVAGPQSASDLQSLMPEVPLSSLYRSLTTLTEAGVLERQHDSDGLARFELAEWLAGHHHHVICTACGTVEDVELNQRLEQLLDEVADHLAQTAGYQPGAHVLEVEGRCQACLA